MTYALSVPAPTSDDIFAAHLGGKLSTGLTAPLSDARDLAVAYTPGVAEVSRAIAADPALAARYTWTDRLVAVVSDGTAVLGLGDIGPRAALPVMEGKSALFTRGMEGPTEEARGGYGRRSAGSTPSRSCSTPPTSTRSSRRSCGCGPASARSTWRTSRRRGASSWSGG